MASFSVQSLVEELHHTESLVQKRPQLAESLVANLESKLTACGHLLPGDLVALYQVLEDSQLQQNHVKALCAILDQKANGSIGGPMKTTLAPVSFDWPQNYLTKEDWEALDKANTWQAIDLLVSRYQSLGIHSVKESTKKAAIGLVVWLQVQKTGKIPFYTCIYQMVQHFTDAFQVKKPEARLCHTTVFPENPKDLPPNVLKAIYGENMPEARYCQGLANLVQHHIPVRSTSKLLVGAQGINKPSKVEPQVQKDQSAETTVGPQDQLLQEMKTMTAHVAKMVEATAMAQVQAVPSQALPLPAPIQQATPQKAPLPLPAPHANDLLPLQGKPQNEAKTLEEYENQAMEQLAKAQKPKGKVEETEAQPKKPKGKKPVTKAGAKKAPGKPGVKPKASAKATASKASTLAKSKPGPKATPANRKLYSGIKGCIRCRGATKGCDSCIFADFGGLRLPGRDAWKKWFQARQRAQG